MFTPYVPITLSTPGVGGLGEAVRAVRGWQRDGDPVQLHSGDLGWHGVAGAAATAAAVRVWSRDGVALAVGLLDSPDVVRLAIDPVAWGDVELAHGMTADLTRPERGVLPAGEASVEARSGALLRRLLRKVGWADGEPWTPLTRSLADPPAAGGLRIVVAGPELAPVRTAVHRASFDRSRFTAERWHALAAGPAYADARCLVGYDERNEAVAAATVWSAGPGRPGLLEPLGVHRDHRGRGHGTAITLAAASALRELGSSSASVCTPAANVGAVAAYRSAGFRQHPDARDLHRGS